jgi:hypothetical protein
MHLTLTVEYCRHTTIYIRHTRRLLFSKTNMSGYDNALTSPSKLKMYGSMDQDFEHLKSKTIYIFKAPLIYMAAVGEVLRRESLKKVDFCKRNSF